MKNWQILKWLVTEGVVERIEEGRARVIYKLRPTGREEKRRKLLELEFENLIAKPLSSLFDRREELTEDQVGEEFNKIIYEGVLNPIRVIFVNAVVDANEDPVQFSLAVDEATEYFREAAILINRTIWNEKTGEFFTRAMIWGY